jgi:PadR family transcriptional regulator PadR
MCSVHHDNARGGPGHPHGHAEHCPGGGGGGWVRGFLQPRLILLLLQKPAHGYDLMERLAEETRLPGADPGLLYRTLRQMEQDGLLSSTWDTEGQGAARRLYTVTPEGIEFLHSWARQIERLRQHLGQFLSDYAAYFRVAEEK